MKSEKWIQYSAKITAQISEMLQDDECSNYIDPQELQEGDNMTDFIQALANAAPARLFQQITGRDVTLLEFNHIANQLVFQYSTLSDQVDEK